MHTDTTDSGVQELVRRALAKLRRNELLFQHAEEHGRTRHQVREDREALPTPSYEHRRTLMDRWYEIFG